MVVTSCGLLLCTVPFFYKDPALYDGGWNTGDSNDRFCNPNAVNITYECSGKAVRDPLGMTTIFIGFFISGIGSSFFHSFGIPYMDDNMSKNTSPTYLGLIYGSRTLGPALGAILGNFCLQIYVYPGLEAGLTEGDEGWLGAWWLGFLIIGSLTALIAPFLALFPQRLPDCEEKTDAVALEENKQGYKTGRRYLIDTKECLGRLLKNKVYMFNLLSAVTALFGFSGLGTFFPKYIEYHFRQKTSRAGLTSLYSSFGTGTGIFLGGFLISKFKFKARTIAAWSMFIGFVAVLSMIALGFLACPKLRVHDATSDSDCGTDCQCSRKKFLPTCSADGETLFLSPCVAGCRSERRLVVEEEELTVFSDCRCAARLSSPASPWWLSENSFASPAVTDQHSDEAVLDFCPSSCDTMFYVTMAFISVVSFLGSTARVGGSIVNLRAVQPEDKSASLILLISALSLFSLFPSPIVFGALLDRSCELWGEECGETTNCLLYDTDKMRQSITILPAVCLAISFLADFGVWRCVGDLQLYQDDQIDQQDTNNLEMTSKS